MSASILLFVAAEWTGWALAKWSWSSPSVCVLRPPWSWCVLVVTNSPVVGMLAHATQQSWSPDPCITAYLTNIFSIIIFYYHLIINLCPKFLNFQEHYCVAYAINDAMVRYITIKPGLSFSHFVFTFFAMWFSFNSLDIAFVVIHSKTRYILSLFMR